MAQQNNKNDPKKVKVSSVKNAEDFNTGSHSPSSVRKVGAGYDDTGKGNNLQSPNSKNKNRAETQKQTKRKK